MFNGRDCLASLLRVQAFFVFLAGLGKVWEAFEAPSAEPVFPKKDRAINYAQNRASFRSGGIRILDSSGHLERTTPFSEADRKL